MSTTSGPVPALRAVSGRPRLDDYLAQLWERRYFIIMRARALALTQHQGTILGNLWLIVAPMLDGMVYYLIFGILFRGSDKVHNFFAYLVIGLFLFAFTSRCINQGTSCIQGSMGLIKAFSFPRAAIPIALVVRELIALVPTMLAMSMLILLVPPHALPKITWLALPVVILIQAVFNLGLTFIVARIGAILPDIRAVIPFCVRIWLYFSCVMIHISQFDHLGHHFWGNLLKGIAHWNPMYIFLDSARMLLIDGMIPTPGHWIQMLCWAFAALTIGFLLFWQKEVRYGRVQ